MLGIRLNRGRVVAGTIQTPETNHAPTDISLTAASIVENNAVGDIIGVLSATDPDAGNSFVYSFVAGTGSTDNASFAILGSNLKAAIVFDYETKNSYSIRVRATDQDGLYFEKVFTIAVLSQIVTADLVQRLFKSAQLVSQDLGTKVIDYSPAPVNANIWQSCLSPTADYQFAFAGATVGINWQGDGVKFECIATLKPANTQSYILYNNLSPSQGIILKTTGFYIRGYKSDAVTAITLTFTTITTPADDSWYRYRISRTGNVLKVERTSPSDINFASATSETKDVTTTGLYIDNYVGTRPIGGICYLNAGGTKFSFGEGYDSTISFSFNSSARLSNAVVGQYARLQNVNCHNSLYGYSFAVIEATSPTRKQILNLSYKEDGTPSTSYHLTFFTRYLFEEFPASKSFGRGYAIKLDASMESYDQENTFFDISHNAIAVYKNTMPSKLNSKLFFDHKNNKELLIYSATKSITRPINTANKTCLIVGDSMASDAYWWGPVLTNFTGLQRTVKAFSGRTLSTNIKTDLIGQVSVTPTLVSDKNFIIIEGGYNDWTQNISEATFASGIAILYAYIRSQNPTAPIFVCGPYNWGTPIDDGTTANTVGMTRNSMRGLMLALVNANSNAYYFDWNLADIIQTDLSDGLHCSSIIGGYNIAKLMYDKILEIY